MQKKVAGKGIKQTIIIKSKEDSIEHTKKSIFQSYNTDIAQIPLIYITKKGYDI